MKQKTVDYLLRNQSKTPSQWREEAEWRRENAAWLQYSQRIAVLLLAYMKAENLTQQGMADRLHCTQQYVSKILKGRENLTLEVVANIERALNIQVINL
jgi:antitoxin component HigA of HigAB toxin-antitoxin module